MTQFAIVLKALDNLLRSGAAMHAEIAPHLDRHGHAPVALINEMARRVERRYGCEATLTETGWRFKSEDGARHEAASKFWLREIRAYDRTPKSNRGGARSAQADAVAKLLKAYEALSAAERRRFKALI